MKLLRDPSLLPKALRTLRQDLIKQPLYFDRYWYQWRYGEHGDEFIDESWDNLIILDAARPDVLYNLESFPEAKTRERTSPGSFSLQFMEEQFAGRKLHDTVYITANPHVHDVPEGTFHAVINLLDENWDEELRTVPHDTVVEKALEASEQYRDKRLIVHFMQPYYPFIGSKGKRVPAGIAKRVEDDDYHHPWLEQMWSEGIDPEFLLDSYRENHSIAIDYAKELVNELPGRSVITSDHANLIGERGFPLPIRLYGHPRYFPHPALITVPWIKYNGEQRDITAEPPIDREMIDEDVIEDRLRSLWYIDG
jgi:hypothetical protein